MRPDLVDQTVMFLAVFLSMSAKMCCKTSRDNEKIVLSRNVCCPYVTLV